jgi:hypothetical protein
MKSNNNSVTIFNARTIGAFFLLVFLAYGFGSSLFKSASNPEKFRKYGTIRPSRE